MACWTQKKPATRSCWVGSANWWLLAGVSGRARTARIADFVHSGYVDRPLISAGCVGHGTDNTDLLTHMPVQVIGVGPLGQLELVGVSSFIREREVASSATQAALDRVTACRRRRGLSVRGLSNAQLLP